MVHLLHNGGPAGYEIISSTEERLVYSRQCTLLPWPHTCINASHLPLRCPLVLRYLCLTGPRVLLDAAHIEIPVPPIRL
eukprot:21016-Eustigmatos_ZCMA.PRE.1